MAHYQPNIQILCKISKKDDGTIELVEIGEFPLSHNPEAMMAKLYKECESRVENYLC